MPPLDGKSAAKKFLKNRKKVLTNLTLSVIVGTVKGENKTGQTRPGRAGTRAGAANIVK